VISRLGRKVLCVLEIISSKTTLSLLARILEIISYKTLQRLIGIKFVVDFQLNGGDSDCLKFGGFSL
jgi:hypothetical protein